MPTTVETTALVKITTTPVVDPAYLKRVEEANNFYAVINAYVVDSPEAVSRITLDVNLGQKIANAAEALKKEYKAEALKVCRDMDAAFKKITDPIEKARAIASGKITKFNAEQREKQRLIDEENARKAREAVEMQRLIDEENARLLKEAEEAGRKIDNETGEIIDAKPVELIAPEPEPVFFAPAPVVQKAATTFGSATAKMVAKVEVVDFAKLPDQWKLPNQKALDAAVKAGVKDIPGCRIWMEEEVKFRTSR